MTLVYVGEGIVLWSLTGLLVTSILVAILTWETLIPDDDKLAKRRVRSIRLRIAELPGWNHILAQCIYQTLMMLGCPPILGMALADVASFMVCWPWTVPLIGGVLYDWMSEEKP